MQDVPARSKHVMQVAWLVADLASAAEAWVRLTGIGPFVHASHVQIDGLTHRGRPAAIDFSVAIAHAGDVQIELVQQHCDRPSAYRDLLGEAQRGLHHIGVYSSNYDADLARYLTEGVEVALSGSMGGGRFAYLDTSAEIGCMVELIEQAAGYDDFFALVAARASTWDGTGPALVDAVA